MGNTCSSSKIPLRIASGIAERAFAPASGANASEAVYNIPDASKAFVKTSESGCFECPGGVICVCERDSTPSWLIIDRTKVDADHLLREVKAEIASNIRAIQNDSDFKEYLDRIGPPLGISTPGEFVNMLWAAADEYVTPGIIADSVYGAFVTGTTTDLLMHVKGRVPAYWCAVAQSNMQGLNSVILATTIMDALSNNASARFAIKEVEITARQQLNGSLIAEKALWLCLVCAILVGGILIWHCLNVRWTIAKRLCPHDPIRNGFKVSC
jgi:hypothetical protein